MSFLPRTAPISSSSKGLMSSRPDRNPARSYNSLSACNGADSSQRAWLALSPSRSLSSTASPYRSTASLIAGTVSRCCGFFRCLLRARVRGDESAVLAESYWHDQGAYSYVHVAGRIRRSARRQPGGVVRLVLER